MKFNRAIRGVIVIEGHVQGLANTRALGRSGIPVVVVSEHDCIAHYSKYCLKFLKCPEYLSTEFVDFLIQLAVNEGMQDWVLIPSNDHAVYNLSKNYKRIKKYFKVISPEPENLEKIYNKELLLKLCWELNVLVPQSWFPVNAIDIECSDFAFPVIIKGKNGLSFYKTHRRKAFLAKNREELDNVLNEIRIKSTFSEIFIQNILPLKGNKPVSFTAFAINGEIKTYWMGIKIREHPFQFGTATYCKSLNIGELLDPAGKIIKALSFSGVCEMEFL